LIFYDTETCGFHGPIVLLQTAVDDGPVDLYCPWTNPISETMERIEKIIDGEAVGFNLAFDHFHLCQMYTTLRLCTNIDDPPDIDEYAMNEPEARDGPCLKQRSALDLMLHARKGKYQSTMNRDSVRIKKIPTVLAHDLARILNNTIKFPDIYFAKKKDKTRWKVMDIRDDFGDIITEFKDIVLSFAPSAALKALAMDALGIKEDAILRMEDIELGESARPKEMGYAPYAMAGVLVSFKEGDRNVRRVVPTRPGNWLGTWPSIIKRHISHWSYNPLARRYARDDVLYTRGLYEFFDQPELDDDDSILACMVGATRWRGFKIDVVGLKDLKEKATEQLVEVRKKFNYNAAAVCRTYLTQVMDETEQLAMQINGKTTTKGVILEELAKWKQTDVCDDCMGAGCQNCDCGLLVTDLKHPAAERAQEILDARHAHKEIELYDKLLVAGRFHASLKVIGALSSRMSGADGLNPQGIKAETKVRSQFPLAADELQLCGGDFEGFEVAIVDAVYGDPDLHEELASGKKIHGILGQFFFPGLTYDDILATKGSPGDQDKYKRSKNGVFALIYMGTAYTLHNRVGVPESVAEDAFQRFIKKYPAFGEGRKRYADMFCSMRQPNGIGTRVEWSDPCDFIETLYGFRRYFTLENSICKVLYGLAQKPPKEWKHVKLKVRRRERDQTVSGAAQSALFAAAFALQSANMRAAGNHVIQGTGAQLTKMLQCKLWEMQPHGIHDWEIMLLNIHDEVMAPTNPERVEESKEIVKKFLEEHTPTIPLMKMEWDTDLKSWGEK